MLISFVRTILLYLLLIAMVRLMGKRQIGQMGPAEFVVTMLAANLASIPMQDGAIPLYSGMVPILTVLSVELMLSWLSVKSVFWHRVFCGRPVILIENGKLCQSALRKTRITLDDLLSQLRQKDVLEVSSVQYAILETGGTLSVFPYPSSRPAPAQAAGISVPEQMLPVTLISDGILWEENLKKMGKDRAWLEKQFTAHHVEQSQVLLMTINSAGTVELLPKEVQS